MEQAGRIILWFVFAALGLTLISSGLIWWFESSRRLTRALTAALGKAPDATLMDIGGHKAAGIDFAAGDISVLWETGARGLIYGLDEIEGAELIVDGRVVGRAQRGEPRRVLDETFAQAERVSIRLIFNDVQDPEFEIQLCGEGLSRATSAHSALDFVRLARKWLSHIDAVLKRTSPGAHPYPAAQALATLSTVAQPPPPAEPPRHGPETNTAPISIPY